jgi:hypothetical protein
MNTLAYRHGLLIALALTAIPAALAQSGLPTSQPKRLTIIREQVKVGRGADHARNEAGWPAAFEKAKSTDYYIAITSMTGRPEAWYLVPWDSHAAEAASMKRDDKDPVLSAELSRLALRDAEFIEGVTTVQLTARPELNVGKFPDVAKIRFYEISVFQVRPGKEQIFEAVAKAYGAVCKRVAPDASYRVYSVAAGMSDPTFFVLSSVQDYADFDKMAADSAKIFSSLTAEEKAVFDKWGDAVVKSETNRFRLDPVQSFVSKEVRAGDPDFWMAK